MKLHTYSICIWFIIIFFVGSLNTYSQRQDFIFEHINSTQGLSNGNLEDILQDSLGFMWFATNDGLNMYNGYEFTVFRHDEYDSNSISNNYIRDIEEDYGGSIWVATSEGVNLYHREKQVFIKFKHDSLDPHTISSNVINEIHIDVDHNLWVGTSNGLNLFNRKDSTFSRFVHSEENPNSLVNNQIDHIMNDHLGRIWVGTENGLSLFDPAKKIFVNFHSDPDDPNSLSSNDINYTFQDKDQNIWIGTFDGGVNLFQPSDSSFVRYYDTPGSYYGISDDFIYTINENEEGELIITTDYGLNVVDKKNKSVQQYFHIPNNDNSLSSNIIVCSYIDVNDRLWLGTRFGGINIYDEGRYVFKHFKPDKLNEYSLNSKIVTSFAEDEQGNFWVGTDGGGLNYYDLNKGRFTKTLQHEHANPKSIANNKVLALEIDQNGNLWIGMWDGGISVYNPSDNTFIHYRYDPNDPNSLSNDNVFDIMEDSRGNIWVGTWENGLNRFNRETEDFTRFTDQPNSSVDFKNIIVVHMIEDHLGNIWIGSENSGLFIFEPKTNSFTHYISNNTSSGFTSNSVFSLYEDAKNRLWIGTNGDGLYQFERGTETFKPYRKYDGLPNEVIKGILEDDEGNLWLSTNKGISKFNPEEETFKNYDVNDGLQNDQFNRWAFHRLSSGEMLFGGINGFNMFKPKKISSNKYIPPVYISDIKLFNKPVDIGKGKILQKNILFTDEIILGHDQNILTIEFVALNYRQTNQNQYKYILEGFQDEWIDAGTERKVSYTNLDPGEYTFKVKGSNNDGVWNEQSDSLRIFITPPFWDTWYFKVGVVLLFLGILFSIFFIRMRVVQNQKQELAQQVAEKTKDLSKINNELNQFAYIVSHDLKAPLRGITNLSDWMAEDLEDLNVTLPQDLTDNFNLMKDRVGRMQKLIEGILNYSRVGRMNVEKEPINSREIVEEVLSIVNVPDGFSIETQGAFPEIISNKTWLEQVFTNLISNAIKYHDKEQGKIIIAYDQDSSNHIFSVEDDGPGISEEYQEKIFMIFQTLQSKDKSDSTGIGLTIVKKIVEEQGGKIWVESDGENGSKFIFTIPK